MAARRTTMNIDHDRVAKAQEILGTDNATATVHKALDDVIRRFHINQLLDWDFDGMTNEQIEAMDETVTMDPESFPRDREAS